jgi:carbonic anhydrase
VIRNVSGDLQSALPEILAIDDQFGLNDIILMKHTDCGALQMNSSQIKERLKARVSPDLSDEIDHIHFGSIDQ